MTENLEHKIHKNLYFCGEICDVDAECGDNVKIYLKIDQNKIITDAHFKAMGSVATIVAASALCSCLLDCRISEALEINEERIQEVTGVFPKEKEASLNYALKALKLAIENYYEKLEKELKKSPKAQKEDTSKVTLKTENKEEYKTVVNERKTVSAAKAASVQSRMQHRSSPAKW